MFRVLIWFVSSINNNNNTRAAHELIDFVVDYMENVRDRPVLPSVQPGYLRPLIPDRAPYLREPWSKIMPDIERYIMPGVSRSSPKLGGGCPVECQSYLVCVRAKVNKVQQRRSFIWTGHLLYSQQWQSSLWLSGCKWSNSRAQRMIFSLKWMPIFLGHPTKCPSLTGCQVNGCRSWTRRRHYNW